MASKRSFPLQDRGTDWAVKKDSLTCLLRRILILPEPSVHDLYLSKLSFLKALSLKTAMLEKVVNTSIEGTDTQPLTQTQLWSMTKVSALCRAEVPGIVLKYSHSPLEIEIRRAKKNWELIFVYSSQGPILFMHTLNIHTTISDFLGKGIIIFRTSTIAVNFWRCSHWIPYVTKTGLAGVQEIQRKGRKSVFCIWRPLISQDSIFISFVI